MSFTEVQKADIRRYLGRSPLFQQYDTALESSMTSIESLSDGGATEAQAVSLLTDLTALEARIKSLWTGVEADKVDELRVDNSRAIATLRGEGRRLVGQLGRIFHLQPWADAFGPARIARD